MPTLTLSRQLGSSMLRFEPLMTAGRSDIADALYVGLLSADFLFEPLEPLGSAYIGKLLQVGEKRELAASVKCHLPSVLGAAAIASDGNACAPFIHAHKSPHASRLKPKFRGQLQRQWDETAQQYQGVRQRVHYVAVLQPYSDAVAVGQLRFDLPRTAESLRCAAVTEPQRTHAAVVNRFRYGSVHTVHSRLTGRSAITGLCHSLRTDDIGRRSSRRARGPRRGLSRG